MSNGGYALDAAGLTAIVGFLMSFVKPFLEALPFARPGGKLHDSTLQAFYVLLIAIVTVAQAQATHTWTPSAGQNAWSVALTLILQVVTMASVGTVGYHVYTKWGASVGDSFKSKATSTSDQASV